MPRLGAKSIVLVNTENDSVRKKVKQWKEIRTKYFIPDRIKKLDVIQMMNARPAHGINFEVYHPNGQIEIVNALRPNA